MFDRLRGGLTFANVTSVVALTFAMGGGAYAITSIPGPGGVIHGCYQKRTGSLRVVPAGRRCARSEKAIKWDQKGVPGARGLQGLRGQQGLQGQKGDTGGAGAPGAPGAPGTARAYGLVSSGPTVTRSKNIVGVTNPALGIWCVQLASGIDATTTVAVVGLDHATDSTEFGDNMPLAFAEVRSDGADCPAGQIDVLTGARTVTASGGFVNKVTNSHIDEDFFIVIP